MAPRKPPAERKGSTPLDEPTPLDELEAEARSPLPESVEVDLAGQRIWVKHYNDWPMSALRALRRGDEDYWASKVLEGDAYERVWLGMDPTKRQVDAFADEWKMLLGQDLGK
jgi:hypothetical protein